MGVTAVMIVTTAALVMFCFAFFVLGVAAIYLGLLSKRAVGWLFVAAVLALQGTVVVILPKSPGAKRMAARFARWVEGKDS